MDKFNRTWIKENCIDEMKNYDKGLLTLRGIHYRMVARGMTNTILHYKRVVAAMIEARWRNEVSFDTFSDYERQMDGETKYEEVILEDEIVTAKDAIKDWMYYYSRNKWERQPYYAEVFIEKKALLGIFGIVCNEFGIALGGCKGYASLTFLHDAYLRFSLLPAEITPVILYFGDYDPSGEDIPRSIKVNLSRMGVEVEVRRIALMENQVIEMGLPPAPTKEYKIGKRKNGTIGYIGDSRDKEWSGLGQVELDAIEPNELQQMCREAINSVFDNEIYQELLVDQKEETETYRTEMKEFIKSIYRSWQ